MAAHAYQPRTSQPDAQVCAAPASHTRAKALGVLPPGTVLLRAALASTGTSQVALAEALEVSPARAQAWCEGRVCVLADTPLEERRSR